MNIQEFLSNYKNHPVLFIGAGISLRYLNNSFTWDGLLRHTCKEAFDNEEIYLDIKSQNQENGKFNFPKIGEEIENKFNQKLAQDRDGKFKKINDKFYELMDLEINASRFKLYISDLLKNHTEKTELAEEISEFKKTRKNVGSLITTNYDNFIENLFEFEVLIGNNILLSNPYGSAYKIHGCVSDPTKIIITDKDYKSFNERYELIQAQLLSIFIHNPIVFLGYNIGDENIKSLLKIIFTYVEPNSEIAEKIRKNFLLVEYEKDSNSLEVIDHDIDLHGFSTIRINKIKTDNYIEIYRGIGSLSLPVSAMDVRKVQNIVKEIYAGGNIGVKITEDIDSLSNSDKILAIGSSKTIQYHYQTAPETIANYFKIIDESNTHILSLIDKFKIQTSQFFPIFGFDKINNKIANSEKLKQQQIEKLNTNDINIPESCKRNFNSIEEIRNEEGLSENAKENIIYYCIRNNLIPLDDCESYLKNHPEKNKTSYRKLLCAYDYSKYSPQ